MLALKSALNNGRGPFCSLSMTKALAQLTLADLKSFVLEEVALQLMTERDPAINKHAFSIQDALTLKDANCWKEKFGEELGCGTLYETDDVVCSWFFVPPGAMLPLHDHCTMVVWQRLLFGRLHINSFDWVPGFEPVDTQLGNRKGGEAVVVFSGIVEARSNGSDLTSLVTSFGPHKGGVMHEIVNASTDPALFINVTTPPYNKPPNYIDCMYYSFSRLNGDRATSIGSQTRAVPSEMLDVGEHVFLTPGEQTGRMPMKSFVPLEPLL
ncbi:cysteamine dioxygenase [Trypanosoma rangeli]|uniref:Cysteamine dioxygenase n=1 Tax=Trypanosoma rangeli TaxID=5698 RepID=A0A422NM88_TRYRA|nr:cysteamine dioxygenase [Trypanosoma rangeli]RNF06546.1 cysteamine dioxygenase [Trypanosoma rangeli]|eukprot:RNF06546.1 cysteamine dioxygenase [Trypanosoma rangeli]